MNRLMFSTKPSPYVQLLKRSWFLYQASLHRIFLLSIILSVIVFMPRFFSDVLGINIFLHPRPFSLNHLWMVLLELASLLFFIGLLWRMHCVMVNKEEAFAEDLRVGFKKIINVLIATLVASTIIGAAGMIILGLQLLSHQYEVLLSTQSLLLCLIVLAFALELALLVYMATLFIFVVPIIATEPIGILHAFERSISLVWNRWWLAFSVQITPWLAYFLVIVFLKYGLNVPIHIYFFDNTPNTLHATLLNLILFVFFMPWYAAVLLLQLKDFEFSKRYP